MAILLLITLLTLSSVPVMSAYSGKVLLVSMDGFRWDYLNKIATPNFDDFAKHGVKLPYMNNSFVTKTFPNHYTIATGLYEETHGITDNHMYDPVFNATFGMSTKEPRWWNGGEPVWVTAKKQGLKTGTYYWPGSEVEIRGVRPDHWFNYSDDTPYKQRVDTVMDWFVNQSVSMATLYFPEPDKTGHAHGPDSPEMRAKVEFMDSILGYLVKKMKDSGLDKEVNVIVTSDHGMASVDSINRVVDLRDYMDMTKVQRVPSYGTVAQVLPVEGQEDAVFKSLTSVQHITVYKKEDMPDRFHYKNNRRIMPIIIIADEGWVITTNKTKQAASGEKGDHGYDNLLMSMKPIFLARGPDFKTNFSAEPIRNVDIYPLICKLLDIDPSPTNGSLERVASFFNVNPIPTAKPTPASGGLSVTSLMSLTLGLTIFLYIFHINEF